MRPTSSSRLKAANTVLALEQRQESRNSFSGAAVHLRNQRENTANEDLEAVDQSRVIAARRDSDL